MATLGSLTLKLRTTRKLLALDLLQSKQEVEQWRQSLDATSKLDIKANVDWDSFSKAESEIRRWVDSLPNTDLQVGAKFVGADLNENLKELERLLKNPLQILVDDKRLFELNEHFKLKERDYKQLQNVLSSPLEIKVDRSQLDNLSRDLRAIENTPQVNLRANVDLDSLRTFHEQLNRYSQGRTLELATSVSRTTLNALQNDLKSLASNLTTARVSVQIDSQLQALRRDLAGLPDTRVQVGVDVDDRRLRELDLLLDRVTKPHKLRLDLPDTLSGVGSEIKKLAFSPITLPVKLAQNAIGGTFTGIFEGIGRELSRNFAKGFSGSIENFVQKKTGMSPTEMGEKSGKYVAKNTYLYGEYAARSQGYEKGLRGVGEDVMKVGESIDSFANPRKFRRNLRKVEDTYVAYQEKINQGDTQGADEIRAAALKSLVEPAQNIMRRVAGVGLRGAAQPYRIRKRVRLAQSIEEANQQAKNLEIPHYDREQADRAESINLVMGGIDFNGTRNTAFASRLMRQVMPKGYTVPLTTPFSNTALEKGGLIGDAAHGEGMLGAVLKNLLGEKAMQGLSTQPIAKLMQIAIDKGFNPDAIRGYAHVKKIREMHPDKPINVMGTSGGSAVAEEIISMAERDGDKNVRGLGIGLPFHGLTGTAGKQFKGTVGDLDGNVFLSQYGSKYTQRKLNPEQLAQLPINLGGILAPNRAQTAIIPNAGIDHNIGIFSTDKGFQNAANKQLGTFINPDFGQGKEGKINGKGVANLNPYVQFGNEDLTIPRTLKAMYGDKQAKKDIVVGGEYSFYQPAHPDWRRDGDFASMKAGVKSKFDKASLSGLPKEHAAEYMGFLDTMHSDLTAFYESKGKIKPSKSLEQAAKYYPELREFATQKGVGNAKFEDAFQYREQPQKAPKPTETSSATPVEVATYNPFAGTATEIQRRRQARKDRELSSFINAANPFDVANSSQQFNPLAGLIPTNRNSPIPANQTSSLSTLGEGVRAIRETAKAGAETARTIGEIAKAGGEGARLLGETAKAGSSVMMLVGEVANAGSETAKLLGQAASTTRQALNAASETLRAIGGRSAQLNTLGSSPDRKGLPGSPEQPRMRQIEQVPDRLALPGNPHISGNALPPGKSQLDGQKEYVSGIESILKERRAAIESAIKAGDLKLLKKLRNDYERQLGLVDSEINVGIKKGDLETQQYLKTTAKSNLGQKRKFLTNIDTAIDLIESDASPQEIKDTQFPRASELKKMVARSILQRREGTNEAGYGNFQANPFVLPFTAFSKFAQSPLGRTRIPGLDFLDNPLKSFKETIGLTQRASAYQGGTVLGGDGTTRYTPPPTRLQSLIANTRDSVERFTAPVKQYIQNYPANARANLNGFVDPAKEYIQNYPANARANLNGFVDPAKEYIQNYPNNPKANYQAIVNPVKQYIQNYPDNAKANYQSLVTATQDFRENPLQTIRAGMILGESAIRRRFKSSQPTNPNTPDEQPPEQQPSIIDRIKANASKIFTNTRDTYDNAVTTVRSGIDKLKGSGAPLAEDTNALEALANSAKNVVKGFVAFAGISFVGGIIAKIGAEAITAAARFQDLKLAVGASTSSKITANALISRSTKQANQLGYNYQDAIASDSSFAAATKGTALELVSGNISTSLRQYNRVLGVSEERQKLSQIAVQQMAGKGTLAAEEVFGQLAESSPGAVNVLARSQGLTIGQLRARMQEGGLNSADTLSRFGIQLDAESTNSVDGASKSTSATIGKVQNSILALQTSVGGQLLAPATAGLNTFNDAIKLTESNVDSIAKVGIAGFLVLGAGAVKLAAKLIPMKMGFDSLGSGLSALSPHMLKFVGQAALAYAAIETISGIWGQFQNTSPLKSISDDLDVIIKKIKEGSGEAGKSLGELRSDKFSKNLSTFEQAQDLWRKAQRTFGADVVLNSESRADQDTITADEILTKTQTISDAKPDLKIAETQKEREGLALELSILRARRANLTSRDRDELQSNSTREQAIIKRQSELDAPITKRQSDLEANIKANRAIADDPLATDSARAKAKQQIADDEAQQRSLQAELSRSSDKITDLVIGLRQLTFESSSALRSIEQSSQIKSTQTYQAATLDPRNIGALQGAQAQNEIEKISARRDIKQQDLSKIQSKLGQNSEVLKGLDVNPDTTSKEKLEFLKATAKDGLSEQVIGYVQQYQQAKQELIDSNQALAKTQYDYIKSIADYNKGLADQNITLKNSLVNLQLTARTSIVNLQQQIEQTLIEIDTNSSKAMFQAQRNKIQGAYNKFLEKLGISTDSIFDQLFQNYNSVIDISQQGAERRISNKQGQNAADNRQVNNELKKDQIKIEQQQKLDDVRRQENEKQNSNPLNQLPASTDKPTTNQSTNLIAPVKGPITSPFGNRIHPVHGGTKFHAGIDYGVPAGTPVKAAGEGVVTFSGTKGGYGYMTEIRHPSGESTRYGHMSKIGMAVGDTVTQGQIIGLSGGAKGHPGSGTSTGAHLHLETRNAKGEPIDPAARLKHSSQITPAQDPVSTPIDRTPTVQPVAASKPKPKLAPVGQIFSTTSFITKPASTPEIPTLDIPNKAEWDRMLATPLKPLLPAPKKAKLTPAPTVQPTPPQSATPVSPLTSGYTNVVSSFYTPGEGGAINGGKTDIRGKYIDRHSMVMATRTTDSPQGIPYGATVELRNPQNGKTTIVKNVDRGTLRPGRDIDLTPAPAAKLGVTADGVAGLQMRVISVPQGQPKPEYDLGGGIGSYDKKGNYTGKSGTIVKTTTTPSIPAPLSGKGEVLGQAILANAQQQGVTQQIDQTAAVSDKYVKDSGRIIDRDSSAGKAKLRQERNLSNQQNEAARTNINTIVIKENNFVDRELPKFKRESTELERKAAAQNRSQDRSPYQQIDRVNQQYGGVRDSSVLDPAITEAQSTVDRIKEENRALRESLNDRIRKIQAYGVAADELSKTEPSAIAKLRKQGKNAEADGRQAKLDNARRIGGTPQYRQQAIEAIGNQLDLLPRGNAAVYNQIAPGTSKALTATNDLFEQYLPKNFNDKLQAEARSIGERFKSVQELIQRQLELINLNIQDIETDIQAKFKAAGYAPQKLDLADPVRLKLMRTIAPKDTTLLEQATAEKLKVSLAGQNVDRNAETAAARSVSIGQKREKLSVDRSNTDYLATTQDGNLFTQMQVDKQRFTQGKTDLDLQFDQGAISADLYAVKLKQLTLDTNTLRNALTPLRGATTGFFDDIFKGQGVFDGLGNALRNLTINILKNFQDIISKQLGQQLFGSLAAGAGDLQGNVASGQESGFLGKILKGIGLVTPGSRPNTNAGMDIGLNQPIIPKRSEGIGAGLAGSLTGMGLNLGLGLLGLPSIPGFATGGMVTSPTLALVGEGINNEAIVPLPNGRSIPVDLKGAGESSGAGNISNAISVTIQNSGQAKETSRGDSLAIATLVQNLVTQGLINEKRPGGLLG